METYLSRIEAILNGEDIKPLSRVEELLKEYGGDGYDETYNTDEDKIKNDAFMLHKDTNFLFTDVGKSERVKSLLYHWDFTSDTPLVDKVNGAIASLNGAAKLTDDGVISDGASGKITLASGKSIVRAGCTIEIGIPIMHKYFSANKHGRFIMKNSSTGFIYRYQTQQWEVYDSSSWKSFNSTSSDPNIFDGKMLKMELNGNNSLKVYADDELIYDGYGWHGSGVHPLYIGASDDGFFRWLVSDVKIYV